MLQDALAYYEEFTGRSASDPAVRLEHGRAYQQMGDIERKLGRLAESEAAYRRAIATLEPLAGPAVVGREAKRSLARTCTLLGDLLVRRGADKGQADGLYRRALEVQRVLADAKLDPAASAEDSLRLGQTEKSQGDLLRLDGKLADGRSGLRPGDRRARAGRGRRRREPRGPRRAGDGRRRPRLGPPRARRPGGRRGRLPPGHREARDAARRFPHHAPAPRGAGPGAQQPRPWIEHDTGRLADAEAHLSRELPLADRLTQDFPDRPEYRRVLARTLSNLGVVLSDQRRIADAEPILRRAVAVNAAVSAKSPDDVQIRFDLAKDRVCLGDLLREKGETEPAIAEFRAARAIVEKLVADFPDRPRYRNLLAEDLVDLALAIQETEPARAEDLYRTAQGLFDELVAAYPDNVDYRIGQAVGLRSQGVALASAGQAGRAEAAYRRALAQLDARAARSAPGRDAAQGRGAQQPGRPAPGRRPARGRGDLPRGAGPVHRAGRAAVGHAQGPPQPGDRRVQPGRDPVRAEAPAGRRGDDRPLRGRLREADPRGPQVGRLPQPARAGAGAPGAVLVDSGKLPEAAAALARAVGHEDRAVQLSKNRSDTRTLLGGLLLELAEVNIKRRAYPEAAEDALRVPRAVPDAGRGEACLDAARILARLVALVGADPKLVPADRERLIRPYLGRSIVLLREAIDSNPKMAGRIKDDPAIKVAGVAARVQDDDELPGRSGPGEPLRRGRRWSTTGARPPESGPRFPQGHPRAPIACVVHITRGGVCYGTVRHATVSLSSERAREDPKGPPRARSLEREAVLS